MVKKHTLLLELPFPILIIFISFFGLYPGYAFAGSDMPNEDSLKNLDALEAIKIANRWKWTHKEIKSYVTSREVVFKFPNGKVYEIPLPEEKMMVAVAPYIKNTHT